MVLWLIQSPPPIHIYISGDVGQDFTNYVALLWVEVGQPYLKLPNYIAEHPRRM
jgi:hypothetical protein